MNKKVLIVDDDPRNIFALKLTLKSRGYQIQSCTMAQEAIDILKKDNQFTAVLMDMMMPEMDGYEAIRIIRSTPSIRGVPCNCRYGTGYAGRPPEMPGCRSAGLDLKTDRCGSVNKCY